VPNGNRKALIAFRMEQAHICLNAAVRDTEAEEYRAAASRSYYCVFHAMRAVLAKDCFDSKKHSGIISAFRERYIRTGIFPAVFSDIIKQAFENRGKSDYEDFFVISKEETAEQIENARTFLAAVEEYIKTIIAEDADPKEAESTDNTTDIGVVP